MKKLFFTTLIFLNLLVSPIFANIIEKIEIKGNQRISDETIIVLGKIKIDSEYDNSRMNNIIKDLYDTNFFSDVSITLEENSLIINVIENYIIEDIEIVSKKNQSLIENLYENISLKNRMSFTDFQLKQDITLIKNILKTNGYYFAKVQPSIIKDETLKSVKIKIDLETGNRAKIKKISFIGNKNVKDKKLLEIIASEEHKFWKFISNKVYLNQSTINLDKRLLENFYRNLGYYKVKVLNSFAQFNNDGNFELTYNIDSGRKFYFNELKLNLPQDYNKSDFNEVENIFKKLKNKEYSLSNFESILDEIDIIASKRLYDFIDAKVDENIVDQNKINFTFNLVDSKKFYVERVNIFGNFQTIEEVIRNELIVDEGDPLNTLLYTKSLDQIRGLRIFSKVKGEIKDGSDENLKIIDIEVEEKPTGEISLAAGVGTSGSVLGGGITEKNFAGKGIDLSTNIEISEDSIKGRLSYKKPNFAYTDNTLFTSINATTDDFLSDFGYKVSETGFSVGTEFEQYRNLFFSPQLAFSIEDLETNSTASARLKKQEGTYQDFYFNYGLIYDLTNSVYEPTAGRKITFYQDLPVVSDNNEISNTFIINQYKKFGTGSEMVGKASLFLKSITTLDNSDVRISKRGHIPYNRLRGFEKGKTGPVENSDFIGGNYISTLNLSTNLPGVLSTVENIDFSYFIDVANVWGVDYDSSIDDSNKIRSSTGIGMNLLTPVGPLSFSLTHPITKASTDKTETFRFNLGTTF